MAESIVKVPSAEAQGLDFLAFSFNGKHSWDDFGIYRTSNGDRYNENLIPTLNDKTAEVPGGDGMYYFGTTHKQKDFNISFAFDCLTEQKLKELKKWLNGKEMGDLWFQEVPYKVWTAKPTGNSSIKYIPFDDFDAEGKKIRVYKGEGTVQFTAYYPYAHTPDYVSNYLFELSANVDFALGRDITLTTIQVKGLPSRATLYCKNKNNTYTYNKSTGGFTLNNEEVDTPITIDKIVCSQKAKLYLYDKTTGEPIAYYRDGKISSTYAKFSNSNEWLSTSELGDVFVSGDNKGDLPSSFVVKAPEAINESTSKELTFTVGELQIIVPAESAEKQDNGSYTYSHYKNIEWDSKTGIVSAEVDQKRIAIPYTGESIGCIPAKGLLTANISIYDGILKYHYWYY